MFDLIILWNMGIREVSYAICIERERVKSSSKSKIFESN